MNKKYEFIEKIGAGCFGAIYRGRNIRTGEYIAIKVESIKSETRLLKNESNVYQYLRDCIGIPKVKWFGKDEVNYYMVIELLGRSLEQLKDDRGALTLRLTMQVGTTNSGNFAVDT
jgi:casein kinase I homolog HRR25